MADQRLVRITIYRDDGHGDRLGYAWGLFDDCKLEFSVLYTRSARVRYELGEEFTEIFAREVNSIVNVDDCWTPRCVYVEAAKRALNGD